MLRKVIAFVLAGIIAVFAIPGALAQRDDDVLPIQDRIEYTAGDEQILEALKPGINNFIRSEQYTDNQFFDVSGDAWFFDSVKASYELGLLKGASDTWFNAEGSVTIAETVTMASRLHSIYNTGSKLTTEHSGIWYEPYMAYARQNGIIDENFERDPDAHAERDIFAAILYNSLPSFEFGKINEVEAGTIPDVSPADEHAEVIYALYNAGVLTGNDSYGTFTPHEDIKRNAVSAIVARIADVTKRKAIALIPALKAVSGIGAAIGEDGDIAISWSALSWGSHKAMYEVYVGGTASYVYNTASVADKYAPAVTLSGTKPGDTYIIKVRPYLQIGTETYTGELSAPFSISRGQSSAGEPPGVMEGMYESHPNVPDFGALTGAGPSAITKNSYSYVFLQKDQARALEEYSNLLLAKGFSLSAGEQGSTFVFYKKSLDITVTIKTYSESDKRHIDITISD